MSTKTAVYLGAFVGSVIGGYVPALWGGSVFSIASLLLSGVGGIAGVLVVLKLVNQ